MVKFRPRRRVEKETADLEAFRDSLAKVHDRVRLLRESKVWEDERAAAEGITVQELFVMAEQLDVAYEELRQQQDELIKTRTAAERERIRYQELFEWAPEGYIVTDEHGVVSEANTAAVELLNVSRAALQRKPLAVYVPQAERQEFRAALTRMRTALGTHELRVRLEPRNREPILAFATVSSASEGPGISLRWLLRDMTAHDTALTSAEQQARELDSAVQERTIEYRAAIRELEREADRRQRAEAMREKLAASEREAWRELRLAHERLESRVAERTAELAALNAALNAEINRRQEGVNERNTLLRQLATAQEDERRRLSRELHDEVGQHLVALRLGLKALSETIPVTSPVAPTLAGLRELSNTLGGELHKLAVQLRPRALDDFGLSSAIESYAQDWSVRAGIEVDVHCRVDEPRLPPVVESAVYRTVQEALTNVLKHADASAVSILIERRGDSVVTIIEDDGRGLDPAALARYRSGTSSALPGTTRGTTPSLGLLGMRERATLLGGALELESGPGAGLTLFVRLPIDGPEGAGA